MSVEKPVYLETWVPHYQGNLRVADEGGRTGGQPEVLMPGDDAFKDMPHMQRHIARQNLAAAAPALVRALLGLEKWIETGPDGGGPHRRHCPECRGMIELRGEIAKLYGHTATCCLDAALAASGLLTPESRDEARTLIAEAK